MNYGAKLNVQKVIEMRRLRSQGASLRDLSVQFGVSEETTREAVALISWKHVKTPYDKFLRKNHRKMGRQQTKHNGLTVEFVRRVFKYDPNEGVLRWNIRGQSIQYGERAGCITNGHYMVGLWDKGYLHRSSDLVVYDGGVVR